MLGRNDAAGAQRSNAAQQLVGGIHGAGAACLDNVMTGVQNPIPSALSELAVALETCRQRMSILESRLGPVMARDESNKTNTASPTPGNSDMEVAINSARFQVIGLTYEIDTLLGRLAI